MTRWKPLRSTSPPTVTSTRASSEIPSGWRASARCMGLKRVESTPLPTTRIASSGSPSSTASRLSEPETAKTRVAERRPATSRRRNAGSREWRGSVPRSVIVHGRPSQPATSVAA